eukprot:scaffold363_cov331-Pavlova_lutheri.AAC.73
MAGGRAPLWPKGVWRDVQAHTGWRQKGKERMENGHEVVYWEHTWAVRNHGTNTCDVATCEGKARDDADVIHACERFTPFQTGAPKGCAAPC